MANKMLIDATHPEETRVVVTRGNRVEEFDYESASRKQLRGNIYLAKVARIEPSLQAAFVNYGGNRHGFLAFAEIHPDYYQVPTAVREALLREEALERQSRLNEGFDDGRNGAGDEGEGEGGQNGDGEVAEPDVSEMETAEPAFSFKEEAVAFDHGSEAEPKKEGAEEARALDQSEGQTAAEREEAAEAEGEGARSGAALPLEAILPPVVYEEFKAALERGREAEDEIPTQEDLAREEREQREEEAARVAALTAEASAEVEAVPAKEAVSASEGKTEELLESEAEADAQPGAEAAATAPTESEPAEDLATAKENGEGEREGEIDSVPEATPAPELVGSEDALEEVPFRAKRRWRQYKIQEVIKRNQIVLVQVVKEERGNKGAALTTYLSLAGRYTVLMPNTASGGGISRKITVPADRKRLKEIAQELEVPEGMGLIIRTAGASRTKAEIKRDYEYLLRLWESVRDLTLKSTAPCLVYEEGDLIKRSIRDLYNKDIDEILVAGEKAYHEAKEFMRMLMPSHAKNVILYNEPEPLFTRYEVERQLNQMFSPVVTLRSGGYVVLNQTEALVAIDVNSGRATREYSIEDTALKTNLEAAEEIARQVRLRDLAGLIVIDFIDMDERRNNRAVERKLKEALRHDRARIQVGHISHFGLLEMSRQRLRQGVVEVSTMPCPVCQGVGHIRSTESVALMILRAIEDHLRTQGPANITASAAAEAALYILNHKRAYLKDIENRYGIQIVILADEKARGAHFTLERGAEAVAGALEDTKAQHITASYHLDQDEDEVVAEEAGSAEDKRSRRKRRRRRSRYDNGADLAGQPALQNGAAAEESWSNGAEHGEAEVEEAETHERAASRVAAEGASDEESWEPGAAEGTVESRFRRHRRRGRRGGRRHRLGETGTEGAQTAEGHIPGFGEQPHVNLDEMLQPFPELQKTPTPTAPLGADQQSEAPEQPHEPQPAAAPSKDQAAPAEGIAASGQESTEAPTLEPAQPAPQIAEPTLPEPKLAEPKSKPVRTGPTRKGWWQRRLGS